MTIVRMIVSGGQAGADRGGLEAAVDLDLSHGGWCPAGRLAEDGPIPDWCRLTETSSRAYPPRTRLNVRDSDATIVFVRGSRIGRGAQLTMSAAVAANKHCLLVSPVDPAAKKQVRAWFIEHRVKRLNVAGTRESHSPGIQQQVREFLVSVLR